MALGTTQAIELVRSLDLRLVMLPDGALTAKAEANKATIISLRNVGLNLAALPNEFLHTLQVGVIEELKS